MAEPTDSSAPPGELPTPATESNAPATETGQPSAPSDPPQVQEPNNLSFETNQEPARTQGASEESEPSAEGPPPTHPTPVNPVPTEPIQHASSYRPPEEPNQPAQESDATLPSIESSLPTIDSSIPAMDTSEAFGDPGINSFDALPSIGSSTGPDLSLPAIDTNLSSMDHSLPAIGLDDIPTMEDHEFHDESHLDHRDSNSGLPDSTPTEHDPNQHSGVNGASHYQPSSNGTYQYSHSPAQSHQPGTPQTQHQFQAQPQQHYQQNNMYHNSGAQGQVPQAPIGSPLPNNMPPMASMGQYMTGYPSNMGQGNAQMRYQLPGDPNKMLSGNRHKKEVKRRTKTGCLTCRKRRIKVSCR